jgi:AraC-like DNA-binding protein
LETAFHPFDTLFIDYIKTNNPHNMRIQHYHDTYEIYLQVSGRRSLFHNNICYTLEQGDLVIFKPFDIHYTESRDSNYYERYVVNFHADSLACILTKGEIRLLFETLDSCVMHLNPEEALDVFGCFQKIESYSKKKGLLSEKLLYSAVFQLIMLLSSLPKTSRITSGQDVPEEIVTALQYIDQHYKENIDLDAISDILHMSKYHFCRLFHNTTGATFLQYLYNIRLTKVHNLLLETSMTLTEIAAQTGFSSNSHLSRVFQKVYQTSPREFRKAKKIPSK